MSSVIICEKNIYKLNNNNNSDWRTRNGPKGLERGLEKLEIGRRVETIETIKIGLNTQKSSEHLRRLALTLVWITNKRWYNNNYNNISTFKRLIVLVVNYTLNKIDWYITELKIMRKKTQKGLWQVKTCATLRQVFPDCVSLELKLVESYNKTTTIDRDDF